MLDINKNQPQIQNNEEVSCKELESVTQQSQEESSILTHEVKAEISASTNEEISEDSDLGSAIENPNLNRYSPDFFSSRKTCGMMLLGCGMPFLMMGFFVTLLGASTFIWADDVETSTVTTGSGGLALILALIMCGSGIKLMKNGNTAPEDQDLENQSAPSF